MSNYSPLFDRIKNEIDFVAFVSQYTRLERNGQMYRGLSPFTSEKTPSFFVDPIAKTWKCYSSQKSGGIKNFVMEVEGKTSQEATLYLADYCGIKVDEIDLDSPEQRKQRLLTDCAEFFRSHSKDPECIDYISRIRNIEPDYARYIVDQYDIGYAPSDASIMLDYLLEKGYSLDELKSSDVDLVRYDSFKKKHVSKHYRRIVFLIRDQNGKIIGWSGRDTLFEDPKRKQPQKYYFNKGIQKADFLYNYHKVVPKIRKSELVIITEGYWDAIFGSETDYPVVAVMGADLSEKQFQLISRQTKTLIYVFDSDSSGKKAMLNAYKKITESGLDIVAYAVILPSKDISDYISQHGNDAFRQLIEDAKPDTMIYVETLFEQNLKESLNSSIAISKTLKEVKPIMNMIGNTYRGIDMLDRLSQVLNMSRKQLQEWFLTDRDNSSKDIQKAIFPAPVLQRRIMTECMKDLNCFLILEDKKIKFDDFEYLVYRVLTLLKDLGDPTDIEDTLRAELKPDEYDLVMDAWFVSQSEKLDFAPLVNLFQDSLKMKRGSKMVGILGKPLSQKEKTLKKILKENIGDLSSEY